MHSDFQHGQSETNLPSLQTNELALSPTPLHFRKVSLSVLCARQDVGAGGSKGNKSLLLSSVILSQSIHSSCTHLVSRESKDSLSDLEVTSMVAGVEAPAEGGKEGDGSGNFSLYFPFLIRVPDQCSFSS